MKRLLTIAFALLCSTALLVAQDSKSAPASAQTSVQGCVQGANGSFTLTDSSTGTTYMLEGDTAKLTKHVGHEVQITGTTSGSTPDSSTGASAGANAGGQQMLSVAKIKHISETCKSAAK